jgi:malate dehydrogenase
MNMMKKIAIIGAGNVGGTAAMRIFESGIARVVLLDLAENLARAKAYDLEDAQALVASSNRIEASSDLSLMEGSDIVVVTAGLPRKPGMTREDLVAKNSEIMDHVTKNIAQFAPGAIVIVVSNPLDVMTYFAWKKLKFLRHRILGMGVSLDTSRFINLIAKKLMVDPLEIEGLVMGSHGETMLPMARLAKVRGRLLTEILGAEQVRDVVSRTKQRGAEIVSLYGSGSAYFAPSAAIHEIVSVILSGKKKRIPVAAVLDGEYGLRDVAIGVPAEIGPAGIERIFEIDLVEDERTAFESSADAIRKTLDMLRL